MEFVSSNNIFNDMTDLFGFLRAFIHDKAAGRGNRWSGGFKRLAFIASTPFRTLSLCCLVSSHTNWHRLRRKNIG